MSKVGEARYLLSGKDGKFSREVFRFDVPDDLRKISRKDAYGRVYLGIGMWKNSNHNLYLCIARGNDVEMIDLKLLSSILESVFTSKKEGGK